MPIYIISSLQCEDKRDAGFSPVKYWETIAGNLKKAGWSLGWVTAIDSDGRMIWIANAHRDNRRRFVAHADKKLAAHRRSEGYSQTRIFHRNFQRPGRLCCPTQEVKALGTMLPKSLILSLVGVLLVTLSVFAGTSVLEGVVKDATGRPIKGADVRIEAKNFSKILKTDASGHYATGGLAVGTYKVMLVINGQVKALILDAKTQLDKPHSSTSI